MPLMEAPPNSLTRVVDILTCIQIIITTNYLHASTTALYVSVPVVFLIISLLTFHQHIYIFYIFPFKDRSEKLIGVMADGYPIYSPNEAEKKITSSDLDMCGGKLGPMVNTGRISTIMYSS